MNEKPRVWKVRVRRLVEDWVEVRATNRTSAEAAALVLPGVKELCGVTLIAEKIAAAAPVGVEDQKEEWE